MLTETSPIFVGTDEFRYPRYRGYWHSTNSYNDRVKLSFGLCNLENLARNIGSGRVLDLGCSCGITTEELSNIFKNCRVYGFDLNRDAIALARNRQGRKAYYFLKDGFNTNITDGFFDCIFVMNNLALSLSNSEIDENTLRKILPGITRLTKRYLLFGTSPETGCDSVTLEKVNGRFRVNNYSPSDVRNPCEIIAREILLLDGSTGR